MNRKPLRQILAAAALCAAACCTAACAAPASAAAAGPPPEPLRAHFIDVGQADSIFFELPGGKTMLIDAGNNGDGTAVVDYIRALGHSSVDYAVGTHPHEDHIGGMDDVVRGLDIGAVYLPNATTTTKTFTDVLKAIQEKKLKITPAKAGTDILSEDGLSVSLLAPTEETYENLNNYSAVVKVSYGQTAFLLMGDAETKAEQGITADVKADVLKVGHHGSDTSTSAAFLERVSPRWAVISVGKGNTYGHPADVTLDRLKKNNAEILRTDESGTIIITSDGTHLSAEKKGSPVKEQAPPSSEKSAKTSAPGGNAALQTVYVTQNGKRYHLDGCRYLSGARVAVTLERARLEYSPCSVCKPPA